MAGLPTEQWPINLTNNPIEPSPEPFFGPGTAELEERKNTHAIASRMWIDGCFDGCHHGHAAACLQARHFGHQLLVGIHADDVIALNKGPTVLTQDERVAALNACRWVTRAVPDAPYVTDLRWVNFYKCDFVGHGSDAVVDANGRDCYEEVKNEHRYRQFDRTPHISTTDLIGRIMAEPERYGEHFIASLEATLVLGSPYLAKFLGLPSSPEPQDPKEAEKSRNMFDYIKRFSQAEEPNRDWCTVRLWRPNCEGVDQFKLIVHGRGPWPGQRIVYCPGGWDFFNAAHSTFLRLVREAETQKAKEDGWFDETAVAIREKFFGSGIEPVYLIVGVHEDLEINQIKGGNYPIMNIFERGLGVMQCRYVDEVIFSAPHTNSPAFLNYFPQRIGVEIDAIYRGPTKVHQLFSDEEFAYAHSLRLLQTIPKHEFEYLTVEVIAGRIKKNREGFVLRQAKKGGVSS